MKIFRQFCMMALLAAAFAPSLRAGLLGGDGIAVYGDSGSQQYSVWLQPTFGYGITYNGTQLNWVDHLAQSNYNFGPTATISGFPYKSYDVAIAGQTTSNLAAQVTAAQSFVTSGAAKVVVLEMGANDFGSEYGYIYSNAANPLYQPLADPVVQAFMNGVVNNITATVNATLAENASVKMILANIPDVGDTLRVHALSPQAAQRAEVTQVLHAVNDRIASLAALHNFPVIDYAKMGQLAVTPPVVGGVQLVYAGGTSGANEFLSDSFHPGTIVQGLFANTVLRADQLAFNDTVSPLSDQTLLSRAGLTPSGPATFYDISPFVIFPTPEPSSLILAIIGTVFLILTALVRSRPIMRCSA